MSLNVVDFVIYLKTSNMTEIKIVKTSNITEIKIVKPWLIFFSIRIKEQIKQITISKITDNNKKSIMNLF